MIHATRLDGREFLLNPDLVECIEATPETMITLSDGRKIVVRDSPEALAERILLYRQQIVRGAAMTVPREVE